MNVLPIRLSRLALISGAALAVSLNAGPASALDFTFSFSGTGGSPIDSTSVTGLITGLADNTPDQTTGFTIAITSATNNPANGWSTFDTYFSGSGFTVSGGAITSASLDYRNINGDVLQLFTGGNIVLAGGGFTIFNLDVGTSASTLQFTPATSTVPGPLPIVGAAAAFRFSRRLRYRCKILA